MQITLNKWECKLVWLVFLEEQVVWCLPVVLNAIKLLISPVRVIRKVYQLGLLSALHVVTNHNWACPRIRKSHWSSNMTKTHSAILFRINIASVTALWHSKHTFTPTSLRITGTQLSSNKDGNHAIFHGIDNHEIYIYSLCIHSNCHRRPREVAGVEEGMKSGVATVDPSQGCGEEGPLAPEEVREASREAFKFPNSPKGGLKRPSV